MKAIKISMAVAAALGAGQAMAFNPQNTAPAFEFRIAGATATTNSIRDYIISGICDSAAGPIDQVLHLGTAHYNIYCTTKAAFGALPVAFRKNDGGSGTGTKPVDDLAGVPGGVVYVKTLRDLSANSSTGCITVGAINGQSALGTAYTRWTCGSAASNLENAQPDFGISDIEPDAFTSPLADPAVGDFTNVSNMTINSEAALPFGVNVTLNLYRALQATQFPQTNVCNPRPVAGQDLTRPEISASTRVFTVGSNGIKDAYEVNASDSVKATAAQKLNHSLGDTAACMPSLSPGEIQTILAGTLTNWNRFDDGDATAATNFVTANAADVWSIGSASTTIRLCRRTSGSGTHAITSITMLKTNCGEGPRSPSSVMVAGGALPGPSGFGTQRVAENTGSSDMDSCLTNVNNAANGVSGSRWGVGYNSVERNATLSNAYRFVKIDGQVPSLANFMNSNYGFFGETTFQQRGGAANYQGAPANAAEAGAIFSAMVNEFKTPATIGTIVNNNPIFYHPFGDSGFAARGTAVYPVNLAAPIAPLEHTKAGAQNSCFGPIGPDGLSPL